MNEDIYLDLEKLSINYFNNFMNKDLINLRKIFDDRVKLIDWNIQSIGIEKVLLEFETIFKGIKFTYLLRSKRKTFLN